jgi:hypothetical protein
LHKRTNAQTRAKPSRVEAATDPGAWQADVAGTPCPWRVSFGRGEGDHPLSMPFVRLCIVQRGWGNRHIAQCTNASFVHSPAGPGRPGRHRRRGPASRPRRHHLDLRGGRGDGGEGHRGFPPVLPISCGGPMCIVLVSRRVGKQAQCTTHIGPPAWMEGLPLGRLLTPFSSQKDAHRPWRADVRCALCQKAHPLGHLAQRTFLPSRAPDPASDLDPGRHGPPPAHDGPARSSVTSCFRRAGSGTAGGHRPVGGVVARAALCRRPAGPARGGKVTRRLTSPEWATGSWARPTSAGASGVATETIERCPFERPPPGRALPPGSH